MKILSSNTLQGIGKYNNDILGHSENFCYVMDGASALFADNLFFETSDLYEYMQLLKKHIKDGDTSIDIFRNGITESNKFLPDINKYPEYELPTFTIAGVKENTDNYELYLLCDCLISILYQDGRVENLEDLRFNEINTKIEGEIAKIDELDLVEAEKIIRKRPIWQRYRKFANAPDGYPVGSTNPESVRVGIVKTINKADVDKILICTDGLFSSIGLPNDASYFDEHDLEDKIAKNHNHDDLTYILIKA
ncbi:hypothetical protein IKF33_01580 [Candidatus Saccharibacteria bacterium]|nr:hypothetical protein [Candidatus Saccharibacteria bacterium]